MEYKIKENMYCNSTNLIYLITCTKCQKQYVGETGRSIRDRVNDHRSDITRKIDTPIGLHFNTTEHKIFHLKIIPIEKIHYENNNYRKIREKFWINKLQTGYPKGLNYSASHII